MPPFHPDRAVGSRVAGSTASLISFPVSWSPVSAPVISAPVSWSPVNSAPVIGTGDADRAERMILVAGGRP
jgi:hypothetical protein